MPEIGEVARIVHFIQKHLVGKTLAVIKAQHDEKVFGAVGTSATEIEKKLTGKSVDGTGQQGKYFWLTMSSPPHLVCHFGMAGWFEINGEETAYYKPSKPKNKEWPPKYWKFILETAEDPKCEAAFVDFRRFGRVRLVDCAAENIRHVSPLKENGPDPVIDHDIVTEEWLTEKLGSKRVPIKALLLDQANISGIGNWVGDEILYHSRIHPEQYSNTLSSSQIAQLHTSLHYVTSLAVETLADSRKFPQDWLFKHRWSKGKKGPPPQLASGERIMFLKVGGRTSAVIPSVQKKTGPVAGDIKEGTGNTEDEEEDEPEDEIEEKPKPKNRGKQSANPTPKAEKTKKTNAKPTTSAKPTQHQDATPNPDQSAQEPTTEPPRTSTTTVTKQSKGKKRSSEIQTTTKKQATPAAAKSAGKSTREAPIEEPPLKKSKLKKENGTGEENFGRRRSARVSGRGV